MKNKICDYEDCDQEPRFLIDDHEFCRYHAVVSLCHGMPYMLVYEAMIDAGHEQILRTEDI